MMTSGLVLTLSADPHTADTAEIALLARPELTLGPRTGSWLPVAAEADSPQASRELHEWMAALPGVVLVDVVHVTFENQTPARRQPKVHDEY